MTGLSGSTQPRQSSPTGLQLMSSYSSTIQLVLKFVLAQLQPIHSTPRQRTLVALLVKLFAILGMRVAASLSILAVDSAMHAGAVAIIVLLLVLLCNQLVLTLRILRNQSDGNVINCCASFVLNGRFTCCLYINM